MGGENIKYTVSKIMGGNHGFMFDDESNWRWLYF